MNKRQRKKINRKRFIKGFGESLEEVKLMMDGKLPKTTWKEFKEELKLIKQQYEMKVWSDYLKGVEFERN